MKIVKIFKDNTVRIRSDTHNEYDVTIKPFNCTCKHFRFRLIGTGQLCKHIEFVLEKMGEKR